MKVHEDVLKMAKSQEERERIKCFYARRIFFRQPLSLAEGLALAAQSQHEDARFFVSLFPGGPPQKMSEAEAVFLARSDDPRCLCWAAECGGKGTEDLWKRSAELCALG